MLTKSLKNKIVWSAVAQIIGKGLQMGLGLLAIKLVTRALGAEEYGMYGKISEFALFFSVAANLGIFGNTVRKMAEAPTDGKLFINALLLRMGTALVFFLVGALWAWLFIDGNSFFIGTLFFMSSLLLDYVTSVCDAMLQANYRMGRATAALIFGRTLSLAVILLLIHLEAPPRAPLFFLAPLAGAGVTASLSLFFVRQKLRFIWSLDLPMMKMLFITALPFGVINIINSLYFRFLPSSFIAQVLSNEQYGSYNICLHLAGAASLLSTFFMFSTLPILRRAIKAGETDTVKALIKRLKTGFLALGLVIVIGGSFLAPLLIRVLSDKEFVLPELWFLLPLLLLLAAISYFYDLVLIILFAYEQEIWFLKKEGLALCLALLILSSTYFTASPFLAILLILSSSIAAETFMVTSGLRKIKELV